MCVHSFPVILRHKRTYTHGVLLFISCRCMLVQWPPCCDLGIPWLGPYDRPTIDEQRGHLTLCVYVCVQMNKWKIIVYRTFLEWSWEGREWSWEEGRERGREGYVYTCEYVLRVAGEGAVPDPLFWVLFESISEIKVSRRPNLASSISWSCS